MGIHAVEKVTESESQAKVLRDQAAAECKQKLIAAQRAAQQELEQARVEAEAKAKQMMQDAEVQAAQTTARVLEQAGEACELLKQNARTHLDEAVQLIVERVVNH